MTLTNFISLRTWTTFFFFILFCLCDKEYNSKAQAHVIRNSGAYVEQNPAELLEDIVHVDFKTPLRRPRDLEIMHYHIIDIRGSSPGTSMSIHVTEKALTSLDFKVVIADGDSRSDGIENLEEVNCVMYSGVVSSDPKGRAAISICGESGDISGLIMKSDGHWMIEPLPVTVHDFERTMKVPHRIRRSTPEDAHPTISFPSDVVHVPKDKLEAAAELALADAEAAQNDVENNLIKETVDVMNETSKTVIPLVGPVVVEMQREDDYLIEIEPLANNAKAKPAQTSTKKPKTKASSSGVQEVVEIAVFTDPEFYTEMQIRYPKETNTKIKEYILTLVNAVDLLYEQKSLGTDLVFKLVHLEIMTKKPSKLKKNGKSAKDYLTSFCEYAGDLNKRNTLWDHGLLLTGSDLKESGSSLTAGLAWAGTMCYRFYSCSVSEALQLGSVYVIAHELGHSMGMDHDGTGSCKSCDANKYLMSPTTGTGKVTWSSCSSKNLKDFIKNGSPELKGSSSATPPVCLSTTSRESVEIVYKDGKLPGQKFDAKKQCKLALGNKFSPHITTKKPFNEVCSMLYCANSTHATTTHAALEGTECASGKICRGGECVDKL